MRIDDYDITSDGQQFILSDVKINTDEESKNFGKEMLVNKKYYTSVDGLLSSIAKNELMISVSNFDSVKDVIDTFKVNLLYLQDEIINAVK